MRRFCIPWLFLLLLSLHPVGAGAQDDGRFFNVPGVDLSIFGVLGNFVTVAVMWIVPLATMLFLVGAIMTVGGAGKEEWAKRGKTLMIGSLTGMAITLLAAVIIKFIFYVIFAPAA